MKKIETIWREILFQAVEKKNRQFTQKEVAAKFGFSTSTVFQALKTLRRMGAVRVSGRFFTLEDAEKLLYHWASIRNLEKDTRFAGHVNLSVLEIETRMPADVVFGTFTAAREIIGGTAPADYDVIHVYAGSLKTIKARLEFSKGKHNVYILKPDAFLSSYGHITTLAQTFVDLWNIPVWYAKEYLNSLKEKIDELLPF